MLLAPAMVQGWAWGHAWLVRNFSPWEFFQALSGDAGEICLPSHLEKASLQEEIMKPSRDVQSAATERKNPNDIIWFLNLVTAELPNYTCRENFLC